MIVEGKVVGSRAVFDSVPLHVQRSPATLRTLLEDLVRQEVERFNDRQERQTLLHVLSERQLVDGASRGKVVSGGQEQAQHAAVDDAVHVAIRAFRDGLYFVFLDERQLEDLDEELQVTNASTLLLLRLTPLAGG
ncbi:hypothetical protein [Deinococcus yavapaiensis]|uniref:Uncharacterized protein n=1 Tax=Deinococcus yavapaiensis KR-236 TaxID=694435 RepID=A0A318S812_9DEIO|nr:hypothetical protein [Deinococcus yavapaiensis]PYE54154.1 hypothetical protein DES52_106119 [Deinococcus yavapaiensis KR-236]